jgi:hypothetical protein
MFARNLLLADQPPDEFKKLQSQWYRKLKESGFEDVEQSVRGRDYLKAWHSVYFKARYDPHTFNSKQIYYERASQFLWEYKFPWKEGFSLTNVKEREIWRLHSEGCSVRTIAEYLNEHGWKANKDNVNHTIQRLQSLMRHMTFSNSSESEN